MSTRSRVAVMIAVCVLALGGAAAYLLVSHNRQEQVAQQASPVPTAAVDSVVNQPHLVFVNTNLHDNYGNIAMVPLRDPTGPRALTDTPCSRVHAAQQDVVCLSAGSGSLQPPTARVLDRNFKNVQNLQLTGIPSRARLSRDAALAATTSFISGDSYAGSSFSTRTIVTRVGGASYGSLENFTLIQNGKAIKPVDRNYWGVTFAADDDLFYVTVAWAKHTYLARGSLSQRTIVTLHEDAECPSLSPDGRHIVFKQRGNLPLGHWRLVSYDVATGQVTPLAETRSVDDQVEWLDDAHVLYGLPRTGSQAAIDDVWSVPIDGSGAPKVFLPEALSPAVVQ